MRADNLMMRDPAMAALMGGMGADFGGYEVGADFGYGQDDWGDDAGAEYGEDEAGAEFSADFGAARRSPHRPSPQAMARAYAHMQRQNHRRYTRELMLDPNQGSTLKVENYTFAVNIVDTISKVSPVFGTPGSLTGENTPNTYLRPEIVTINTPIMGLVSYSAISVGNVNGTVGGQGDAFDFSPLAPRSGKQSYPLLSSSTKVTFAGSWKGFTPAPYNVGDSYDLVMSFKGPATMLPRG